MKLCNYCETALPEDASICIQCHMVLGDERTIGDAASATEMEDVTIKGWPVVSSDRMSWTALSEMEDVTIKGWPVPVEVAGDKNGMAVIPNPETPIPDIAFIEDLPTLANDALVSPDSTPTKQDKDVSDELTVLIEQDAEVITDDPTPPLPVVNDAVTITDGLNSTAAADLDADTITDDPTPILPDTHDLDTVGDVATPALLIERNAETITDDPTPAPLMGHAVETITDDPTPASLLEEEAVEITDDPRPVLEHQSDTAIIRADAPIPETDPNLSIATIDALATLTDHDDDPTPGNGHLPEYGEERDSLPVMTLPETGEEASSRNGHAIPAPLYPDYGKAINTPPAPLYEDHKKASNVASASPPLVPRQTSAAPTPLWSRRGLIAIALCFLIILSSIGLFISQKKQTGGQPIRHAITAKLDVMKHSLTSQVVKGHKVILAAEIANTGGQALHWTTDTGNTAWLSIDKNKSSGTIPAGAPQQMIYVRADATALDVGNFTGAIQLHSNGGNSSISVMLHVLPATGKPQPVMTVDQTALDFGSLSQGQQATQTVNIGNAGTATLNWKADIGSLNWIALTPTSGTILAGGYPQLLTVTIQTTNLKTGFTPASINFTSNASVPQPPLHISVNVTASNGNALTISASPGSFTNGCLNCSIMLTASQGSTGAQTSVQWSASGAGVPGITFNPSTGTLLAGQSVPVMVTVPNTSCPASANFTFTSAANTFSVLWSCTPPPTPNAVVTVSPTSLTNCYTCTVYISPAAGSQSSLKWTSSSRGINGISINPSQSTVAAGNSQAVTVTVPNTNCPANANSATFYFNGQGSGNSASVTWSCTAPTPQTPLLSVNPSTLNSSQCAKNSDGTYNCSVTLSESPVGNLSWSTYSNVGGNFSQSTGSFSSGFTQTTITVNNLLCQTGSFVFNGPNNSAPVQWTCNPPQTPVISVNPQTLNSNSSACSSDGNGGYTCTVTLSESPQGTINWQESDNLGVSVSPQNGTLTPGNSSPQITLFSIPCSSQGTNDTFTFSATGSNNASVTWSCTAPPTVTPLTLSVSTQSFVAGSNCSPNSNGWSCSETLNASNGTGTLSWSASSDMSGVTFSPQSGSLNPGGGANITINIPTNDCGSGNFFFAGSNTQAQATWSCTQLTPPQISLGTPSISFPNESANATFTTNLIISNTGGQTLTWSVTPDSNWLSVDTPQGTINAGSSQTINVIVNTNGFSSGQTYSGNLSFNSNGGSPTLPVSVSIISPPVLTVNPNSINANNDCSWAPASGYATWTCSLTLHNAPNASSNLNWSASSSGFSQANMTASFSPNSDTIAPGGQETVTLTITTGSAASSCWSNGLSASLTFTSANPVTVPWSCTAPYYTASTNNINGDTDCQHSAGNPWVCQVTLTQQSQGYTNFSIQEGDSGANATFNPSTGWSDRPGQQIPVTITVILTISSCPASVTITFLSTPNVTVNWSCSVGTALIDHNTITRQVMLQDRWRREMLN